jgi:enoyl-CoA hydratase/carnithine racemase
MSTTGDLCLLTVDGSTGTVTLNRPQAKNALNLDLLEAVLTCLDECSAAGVDVLVLRAEGTAFCAGADVRSDDGTERGEPGLRRVLIERVIERVQDFPFSVASVHGPAVGGGWGLAFATDVVVAADRAMFKFPELALGFLPPPAIVRRFVHVAGPVRALRLLATGEAFRADSPALSGLVEAVPPADLAGRTEELAAHLSRAQDGMLTALRHAVGATRNPLEN